MPRGGAPDQTGSAARSRSAHVTRRSILLGVILLPACSQATGQEADSARPEMFGARAGPGDRAQALANTTALRNAFNSGRPIEGGGRSYDILGELRVSVPTQISGMTLRQRAIDTRLEKTVLMDGISGQVSMRDVTIDMMGLQQTAGMGQCSALQISHCSSARLNNVTVINGGGITGVKIIGVGDAEVDGLTIRDFAPRYPEQPVDDVCQGVEFQYSPGFRIRRSGIYNLAATWPDRPRVARQFSRGVVCGHGAGGRIESNTIGPMVEQGIDLSSSRNADIEVIGNRIVDCGTWGVKCANRFRRITIRDNLILRPGCAGVTCSAPGDAGGEAPSDVTISGNTILNPGASGLWAYAEPAGIILYARAEARPNAPSGVTAFGNRIIDDQTVHTMARGLDAQTTGAGGAGPPGPWTPAPGGRPNRAYDNEVSGYLIERSRGWSR